MSIISSTKERTTQNWLLVLCALTLSGCEGKVVITQVQLGSEVSSDPTPSSEKSPSPSASPQPSPSMSQSPDPLPTPAPSATHLPSPSPVPAPSPTIKVSPVPSPMPTSAPSAVPSPVPSSIPSSVPSPSPSAKVLILNNPTFFTVALNTPFSFSIEQIKFENNENLPLELVLLDASSNAVIQSNSSQSYQIHRTGGAFVFEALKEGSSSLPFALRDSSSGYLYHFWITFKMSGVDDAWTNILPNTIARTDVLTVWASGNSIYVGTISGGLSISSDAGATWTTKTLANSGVPGDHIRHIFLSGSTIFAAMGQYNGPNGVAGGGLAISTDNGATWTSKGVADGFGSDITYKVYASGHNVYVATANGLAISTDMGATWTNKTAANGLGSISNSAGSIHNNILNVFASSNTVYAATMNDGLGISTDNGNTWTKKTTANGLASNSIGSVFASGDTIYAGTRDAGLSISRDAGKTWATKLAGQYISSVGYSGNFLYVIATQGIYLSADSGNTWTTVSYPSGLSSSYVLGSVADGNSIYLAACTNGVYISTDAGKTWINKNSKTPSNGLKYKQFKKVAVANNGVYGLITDVNEQNRVINLPATLALSMDGAKNWVSKQGPAELANKDMTYLFISGNNLYVASHELNAIFISSDNGNTWRAKSVPVVSNAINNIFVYNSVIYVSAANGLLISKDEGRTWENKTLSAGIKDGVWFAFVSGPTLLAGTNSNGLLISNDDGATWVSKKTANIFGQGLVYRVFASGNTIYAGIWGVGLAISTDSGNTWSKKSTSNGLGSNNITSLWAAGDIIYATTDNGLSISMDGGNTWMTKTVKDGLGSNMINDAAVFGGYVYAATDNGLGIGKP